MKIFTFTFFCSLLMLNCVTNLLLAQDCSTLYADFTASPVYCTNSSYGYSVVVCVTPSGGTAPYQFSAMVSNQSILVDNLQPDLTFCDTVEVEPFFFIEPTFLPVSMSLSDANACSMVGEAATVPVQLFRASSKVTHATCNNADGEICILATGGSGSFRVMMGSTDYGIFYSGVERCIGGLAAGEYALTLIDELSPNCTQNLYHTLLNENENLIITTDVTPSADCATYNPTVCLAVSGGTPPYQIEAAYATSNTSAIAAENELSCLNSNTPNNYFNVTDFNGCAKTVQVNLIGNTLSVALTSTTPATTCNGMGQACFSISGGTAPYTRHVMYDDYIVLEPVQQNFCIDVPVGQQHLTLSDDACGWANLDYEISSTQNNIQINNIAITNENCEAATANLCFEVSGGAAPYQIELGGIVWATLANDGQFCRSDLAAGTYHFQLSDANGCQYNQDISIGATCPPITVAAPCPLPPIFYHQLAICSNEPINLAAIIAPATIQSSWHDNFNNYISNDTALSISNTSCEPITYTFTDRHITADGCVFTTQAVGITIYPELSATIQNNLCTATLVSNCPNYSVTWTDGNGNSGTGNTYQTNPNEIGNVVFTLTNNDAPNLLICAASATYETSVACELYPCDPIPPTFIPINACSGETLNLSDWAMPVNAIWYDESGNAIANPDNYTLPINTTCQPMFISINDIMTTPNCPPMPMNILSIAIYPEISATIQNDFCSATLVSNCPNYSVTWTDGNGNSGTGNTYQTNPNEIGNVVFTLTNNDAPNLLICAASATYETSVACELYPCDPIPPTFIPINACSGETLNLSDWAMPTDATWYDESGNAIANPDNYILPINTTCQPMFISINDIMTTPNCPPMPMNILSITIYPNIVAAASLSECGASVYAECPNYSITWTDSNGNSGTGSNYIGNGTNTAVIFTVSYPDAALLELTCSDLQITANVSCDNNAVDELCAVLPQTVCTAPITPIDLCVYCPEADIFVQQIFQPLFSCGAEISGNCVEYTPLPGLELYSPDSLAVIYCLTANPTQCDTTYFVINVGVCNDNETPVAEDDYAYSDGTTVAINALSNDSDLDGDILSITTFGQPQHGTVLLAADGLFYYTPDAGFEGSDLFSYQVCDPTGACAYATVYIETSIAEPCQSHTTICAEPVTPIILCPDFCHLPPNTEYEIITAQTTFNCALQLYENTCLRYTALPLFAGQETIRAIACTALGVCDTAYITVQVADCDPNGGFAPDYDNDAQKVWHYFGSDKQLPLQLINIMPQPARDEFTIYFSAAAKASIQATIIDLNGNTRQTINLSAVAGYNKAQCLLDDMPAGMYFLQLNDGQQISTAKLLIAK
jgi:hypothetical protein